MSDITEKAVNAATEVLNNAHSYLSTQALARDIVDAIRDSGVSTGYAATTGAPVSSGQTTVHAKPRVAAAEQFAVIGDYLAGNVGRRTCDGPFETYGHRPECGYEPIMKLDELTSVLSRAGRVVVDQPEQWTVFDLQPDDVLLIGNVHGVRLDMDEVTRRLRDLYPERRVIFFSDDIDVTTLRDAEQSSGVAGGGVPHE